FGIERQLNADNSFGAQLCRGIDARAYLVLTEMNKHITRLVPFFPIGSLVCGIQRRLSEIRFFAAAVL
ncbi:hypothetical protein BZU93_26935, partial [Salmonella enterica subsp. enterica]|nr:hypothetical protein [Salmonella enterica subsp. enterica serovar Enteritidis]